MITEKITILQSDVRKLLGAASGDAALLYIYLSSGNPAGNAAEELRIMAEKSDWDRARATIAAYIDDWEDVTPWLQILINHDDIDDVTLALTRLEAAVVAREQGDCYEACAELAENARHIHHRDAFTLGNVL